MTYFEQKGVDIQYNSRSIRDSQSRLNHSCTLCCCRGLHIDCDRCAIAHTAAVIQRAFSAQGERRMAAQVFRSA